MEKTIKKINNLKHKKEVRNLQLQDVSKGPRISITYYL